VATRTNSNGNAVDPNNPLLQVTSDDHVRVVGEPEVTVIEYGDFECPVCGRFAEETYPTVRAEYVDTGRVRWVFRHFPLTSIHPRAEPAARAAECAAAQFRFFEYHDELFAGQPALSDDDLRRYADELDLNLTVFDNCLTSGATAAAVRADRESAIALGASGTPTFFIGGQRITGFRSVSEMRALLEAALAGE